MSRIASLLIVLAIAGIARAQGQQEPLVKKVKTSIRQGVTFLVDKQAADGSWDTVKSDAYRGGPTALALLALMQCDEISDDPQLEQKRQKSIERGLVNLRNLEAPTRVYVRALQTMALVEAGNLKKDRTLIEQNVKWLLEARVNVNGEFVGWSYENRAANRSADASNSQYAMLALWYARQADVAILPKVWEDIRAYYTQSQRKDGSWAYSVDPNYNPDEKGPSVTMTVAGVCGLQIASMELDGGREQWQPDGKFKTCGNYGDDRPLALALRWLGKHFTVDLPDRSYYHLYGLERAGRLTGQRFFGEHDWYREGCEYLVKQQQIDGSWKTRPGWDSWPHVNTSFALLFLSKGRTPVLISKLVHGNWPRREDDLDWNNDRNDLRHLTDFIAKKTNLFGKKPLAWQTYDIARAREAYKTVNANGADVDTAIVADMKQSPILYITGHESLLLPDRFTGVEIALIKRYVENGGFIFAEACCGSDDFDKSFKQWVHDTWGQKLEYLKPEHPVWTCENIIRTGEPYDLMGLHIGCRTVMLYSPKDLSCHWESGLLPSPSGRGAGGEGVSAKAQAAFRLGANIIAYGTGRTPPQPRLTLMDVGGSDNKMKQPRGRGIFHIAQIQLPTEGPPAPRAMSNLLEHVHKVTGLDVSLKTEEIKFGSGERAIRKEKFLYLHGRKEFNMNAGNLAAWQFTLKHGGLLFADACCGNEAFDKSFRKLVHDLFPKEKFVRVPFEEKDRDPLFSAKNNGGAALTAANIQCRTKPNGEMQPMEPLLEGIQIDGRWVVLYSRYDIGCALERHTSPDCVGYAPESALRIASAVVRYHALR